METWMSETLKSAWDLQQQQQYGKAEAAYWKILAVQPRHSLALFLLGRLELELGRHNLAATHLAEALRHDPSHAVYYATLARAQQALGCHRDAVKNYRAALELEPDGADYYVNLGNALLHCKEAAEAITCYEKAIECDPQLAQAHSCLGATLEHRGRMDEALAHYRKAIALQPTGFDAHYNLGTALLHLHQPADALQSLVVAVGLQPRSHAAHGNLAAAYHALGREAEARLSIDQAIELAPDTAEYHCNLATILRNQGRPAEAIEAYDQALAIDPKHAEATHGRSLAQLSLGRLLEAWEGFERRVDCQPAGVLKLDEPLWDGSPLDDRTLLVHDELGLHNTIQFIRFIKLVEQRTGTVVLAVRPDLVPFLVESGFQGLVARNEPLPKFDVQSPLLSLPGILGIELETIPRDVPYLDVKPARIERWREALAEYRGFRVGISWQEEKNLLTGDANSIPLDFFARLINVPGVDLISLQQEDRDSPARRAAAPSRIAFLDELGTGPASFADVSAVMKNLDLVIAADSVAAHLAGALGVPVWLALRDGCSWRWMVDRDDSPWYPTMRLFRQESLGDWSGVFDRMAKKLAEVARRPQDSP